MSKGNFSIGRTSQSFNIDIPNISGFGDKTAPVLRIPLELALNPLDSERDGVSGFAMQFIEANVSFNGFKGQTSKVVKPEGFTVFHPYERTIYLDFPLDHAQIDKIEKCRNGNALLHLSVDFHYAIYSTIRIMVNNKPEDRRFVTDYGSEKGRVYQQIEIPQSQWVTKVLPGLGFRAFKLIEIPLSSKLIPEEYATSIKELEEATKYFDQGDYDKTVAHCRTALDPLYRSIKVLKPLLDGKSDKDWMSDVTLQSYKWFDTLVKQTWRLGSKTHHIPSIDHFDREEAQIIFLMTTALIAYFGKIKLPTN